MTALIGIFFHFKDPGRQFRSLTDIPKTVDESVRPSATPAWVDFQVGKYWKLGVAMLLQTGIHIRLIMIIRIRIKEFFNML